MKIYSKTFRNNYHKEFHFGYTENIDLLSNIAIWSLSSPVLFILNSTNYEYTLIDVVDEKNRMIDLDYDKLLDDLRNNRLQVDCFFHKFKLIWLNFKNLITSILGEEAF